MGQEEDRKTLVVEDRRLVEKYDTTEEFDPDCKYCVAKACVQTVEVYQDKVDETDIIDLVFHNALN